MIKNIEKKDIPQCTDLIRKSFITVAEEFNITPENAPKFTAFSITKSKLNNQLKSKNRIMRGYFHENKIIGYYALERLQNGVCELNNLCVHPDFRQKGIGEELIFDASSVAENSKFLKIQIGIVEENQILRKWYEAHGFVHTGTKKFDFFPFTCGYMEKVL